MITNKNIYLRGTIIILDIWMNINIAANKSRPQLCAALTRFHA